MMILLLLFLQKQSLEVGVYVWGNTLSPMQLERLMLRVSADRSHTLHETVTPVLLAL